MQKFIWDDSLSVGVKLIDEQHKVWIERLNDLSEAVESHREVRQISKVLNFMMDYVEFHFSAEENLMAEHNYPGAARHKQEHQKFREILMDLLVLEIEEDEATATFAASIYNFQVSWLKEHIQQVDRRFAEFLKGQAVAFCSSGAASRSDLSPAPHDACRAVGKSGAAELVLPKNPAW